LRLKSDVPPSSFAFHFNLRLYSTVYRIDVVEEPGGLLRVEFEGNGFLYRMVGHRASQQGPRGPRRAARFPPCCIPRAVFTEDILSRCSFTVSPTT
jgi:hypothetical protein